MNITTILFMLLLEIVGLVDFWLLVSQGPQATFSAAIYGASRAYPIIPLLTGVLCGHLFFPNAHP